jgi:hypothetical protein
MTCNFEIKVWIPPKPLKKPEIKYTCHFIYRRNQRLKPGFVFNHPRLTLKNTFSPQYPPKKSPHFQFATGKRSEPASSFLLQICRRLALLARTIFFRDLTFSPPRAKNFLNLNYFE